MNTPTTVQRRDLTAVLPHVVRRVLAAEFSSQSALAEAYGVDKATVTRWRQRAAEMGLTNERSWRCAMCDARDQSCNLTEAA